MAGNEIDLHATLNDLKTPRANDGGREAVLVGFVLFVILLIFLSSVQTTWVPTWAKAVACIIFPMAVGFATLKFVRSFKQKRQSELAVLARKEDSERKEKLIAEARANGDFDRWNSDE